jgi:hypothetical protein
MDAFDETKAKEYYDEILKLKKSLEIYEKKRDAHRKICLDNSNKMKEIIVHCDFCEADFKKTSWCNHLRSDKHKKNLLLKAAEK